jgi:hypothetical protein
VRSQDQAYDPAVAQLLKKSALTRNADQLVFDSGRLGPTRMNRRRSIRYPLRALALFQWQSDDGVRKHARGWTKDVSEAGAYVVSPQCPNEGDAIQLVLRFPVLPTPGSGRATEVDMIGCVLRVNRDPVHGRELGFAVRRREGSSNPESEGFEKHGKGEEQEVRLKALRAN